MSLVSLASIRISDIDGKFATVYNMENNMMQSITSASKQFS